MQFSPASCHFHFLKSKCPPQTSACRQTEFTLFTHCDRPSFKPILNYQQNEEVFYNTATSCSSDLDTNSLAVQHVSEHDKLLHGRTRN